ncbi:MAG: Gp37 family protein [SAR324 cluster bacterium]|nr:Gp37 family protein [SAR324 cluster bacterium]
MIQDLLTQVTSQLERLVPQGIKVEEWPDNALKKKLSGPKGSILVKYQGAKMHNAEELGCAPSPSNYPLEREVKISVTVASVALNGQGGALELLDQVTTILGGFEPTGWQAMIPIEDSAMGQVQNHNLYAVLFKITSS